MRRTIQAAAAGLVLATAGCASAPGDGVGSGPSPGPPGSPTSVDLHLDTPIRGQWRLTDLTRSGRTVDITGVSDPSARFDGLASFSDGCHAHSHRYRVTGSTVRFDVGAVTANWCAPGPWSSVSDALDTLDSRGPVPWRIDGDRLTLTSGRYVLTYRRTGATKTPDLPRTSSKSS